MNFNKHEKYYLSANDVSYDFSDFRFQISDFRLMVETVSRLLMSQSQGGFTLSADEGVRPWWQRFLGIERYIRLYLQMEWCDGFSGLFFYDEEENEVRVIRGDEVDVDVKIRAEINFGEMEILPSKYCIDKPDAIGLLKIFFELGNIPVVDVEVLK